MLMSNKCLKALSFFQNMYGQYVTHLNTRGNVNDTDDGKVITYFTFHFKCPSAFKFHPMFHFALKFHFTSRFHFAFKLYFMFHFASLFHFKINLMFQFAPKFNLMFHSPHQFLSLICYSKSSGADIYGRVSLGHGRSSQGEESVFKSGRRQYKNRNVPQAISPGQDDGFVLRGNA